MKVTGFSFIRNAIKYDYPIRESLLSLLPLCDEVVVAVGASEDGATAVPPTAEAMVVSLPEIEAALAAAAEFPMTLFEAEHLARYIEKIKAWREKARAVLKSPVRDNRTVDNLLNAALKFPLQLEEVQSLTEVKQWGPVEHQYSTLFKGPRVSQRKFEELLARSTVLPPGHPLLPVLESLEEEGTCSLSMILVSFFCFYLDIPAWPMLCAS